MGTAAYSVGFEQEANNVGMYILARGGFPIEEAPAPWRRHRAVTDPKAIKLYTSHSTTLERFVALEKIVEEIRAKQAGRPSLFPDPKPEEGAGNVGRGAETSLEGER